jgi:selenocysteine lyase/cysteine desulfurase
LHARTAALKKALWEGLSAIDGVEVRSPLALDGAAIVTITAETLDPAALAARLDREYGVLARPGLHCAPEAHRLLGTESSGALRFSLGWASTLQHVERAVAAVQVVLHGSPVPVAARTEA